MSLFEAQFGGAPLINTYQFSGSPGLPDMSGIKSLLMAGAARGTAAPARAAGTQRNTGGGDVKGLEGETREYIIARQSVDAEKNNYKNVLFDKFQNEYQGSIEDFYMGERDHMNRKMLQFQEADATLDANRQTMEVNNTRLQQVIADKDIAGNLAINFEGGSMVMFGERKDGTGFGWGRIGEIYSPMTGAQAAMLINRDNELGQIALFPVAYDQNIHYTEINTFLTSAELSGGRTTRGGPQNMADPYSDTFLQSGEFRTNRDAIFNIVSNAYNHLSPEGRMALQADAFKNLRQFTIDTPTGSVTKVGIPDYEINMTTDSSGRSTMVMSIKEDGYGNPILLDINNPEEHEAALRSHATKTAAVKGQSHLQYTLDDSFTVAFGRQREGVTGGIHMLVATDSFDGHYDTVIRPLGAATGTVSNFYRGIIDQLSDAPDLQNRFRVSYERFIKTNSEIAAIMDNPGATEAQKVAAGGAFLRYVAGSGHFTAAEIDKFISKNREVRVRDNRNVIGDVIQAGLDFFRPNKFVVEGTEQVELGNEILTLLEQNAATMKGNFIRRYTDAQENAINFNGYIGYAYEGTLKIHGSTVNNSNQIGNGPLVVVAQNNVFSPFAWQTSDFRQSIVDGNIVSNINQMPHYMGRGAYIIVPRDVASNLSTGILSSVRGKIEPSTVDRWKVDGLRRSDRDNMFKLNSPEFRSFFPSDAEADNARARLRALYGLPEDGQVVFLDGILPVKNPVDADMNQTRRTPSQSDADAIRQAFNEIPTREFNERIRQHVTEGQ